MAATDPEHDDVQPDRAADLLLTAKQQLLSVQTKVSRKKRGVERAAATVRAMQSELEQAREQQAAVEARLLDAERLCRSAA